MCMNRVMDNLANALGPILVAQRTGTCKFTHRIVETSVLKLLVLDPRDRNKRWLWRTCKRTLQICVRNLKIGILREWGRRGISLAWRWLLKSVHLARDGTRYTGKWNEVRRDLINRPYNKKIPASSELNRVSCSSRGGSGPARVQLENTGGWRIFF